ncbi:hypothetical protein [Nitratireductor sp. GCM10026969]|uniref:hypothetical protein n=1 Tax=Nitratireductor sp. GCM10026969 TaxID=3252645 RepID=UPI00361F6CA7
MVQVTDAIAELRELINADKPLDHARCRRLLLRVTSRISDVQRASALIDLFELRFAALEMAEFMGTDGKLEAEQISELLNEMERLAWPS